MKDPYKILQVDPDAEMAVIEAAYKGLARRYHPDVNSSPKAAERMTDINWAYEILHDPQKREAFRQSWKDDKKKSTESSGNQGQTNQSEGQERPKQRTEENVNQETYTIFCQTCGSIGPTKKVSFRYNIGLLFFCFNKHIEGNLCRNCIEDYFWKYTAIDLFLGWWGLISFFVTPFYILENLISYVSALNLKRRDDKHGVRAVGWKIIIGVTLLSICLYLGGPYLALLKPDTSNLMNISLLPTRPYTPTITPFPTITFTPTRPPTPIPIPTDTQVPTITPSPTITRMPAPGDVILFENFEDKPVCFPVKFLEGEKEIRPPPIGQPLNPNPLPYSAIVKVGDTWIQDGKLYIYSGESICKLIVDNFSLILNIFPVSNSMYRSGDIGIMFRKNEERYYLFTVAYGWEYECTQCPKITSVKVFVAYFDGQKNNILGYIPAYKISKDNINLGITAKASQIIISLYGEKVLEFADNELSSGYIGLVSEYGQASFDDIRIIKQ